MPLTSVFFALPLIVFLLVRLFGVAERGDADLHVYWQAAHHLVEGVFPYRVATEDAGFVFKYPPWILPWFLPLAALSWQSTRWLWFGLEVLSVAYSVRWVIRAGVSSRISLAILLTFWWIWRAHFEFGQLTVLLLALALWACPAQSPPQSQARPGELPWRTGLTSFLFTAKLFSAITLLGLLPRFKSARPWLAALAAAVISIVALWIVAPAPGFAGYLQGWAQSAASGGKELGEGVIRGLQNHSFTTRILMAAQVPAANTRADLGVSLMLSLILGTLWWRFAKNLSLPERWAGWIALGVVIHPLAWDHSFVMAYPLCALSVSRCARTRNPTLIILASLGVAAIALFVPQLLGSELVRPIELCANKCWGVVLSGAALALAARSPTSLSSRLEPV